MIVSLLLAVSLAIVANAEVYTVLVGVERINNKANGMQLLRFYPEQLSIRKGDTVIFEAGTLEPHTVTFNPGQVVDTEIAQFDPSSGQLRANPKVLFPQGNPIGYDGASFLNSGFLQIPPATLGGAPSFSVVFSKTAVYPYYCALHPSMVGTIQVLEVTDPTIIPTPDQVKKASAKLINKQLAGRFKGPKNAVKDALASKTTENGVTTHYVNVGWMEGVYEYYGFFPKSIVVKKGDKVVFQKSTFHTVTFLNGNPPIPLIIPADNNIPPTLIFNPAATAPQNLGVPLTKSSGLVYNSGLMTDPVGQKFTIEIGQEAGKYEYVCIPHFDLGMKGTVIVKNK